MNIIFNFVNPTENIINRINIHTYTSTVQFKYVISSEPLPSADIIIISSSHLGSFTNFSELEYIPYIVYGGIDLLEKSFILGSCDYLKDPWTFNELEIRAKRFINRDELSFNWGNINFSNSFIQSDNETIPFSVNEYKILSMLNNNSGKIISRENLHYRLGISNKSSRVIDVYINSIRKKIKLLSKIDYNNRNLIKTVRGKGYTINS